MILKIHVDQQLAKSPNARKVQERRALLQMALHATTARFRTIRKTTPYLQSFRVRQLKIDRFFTNGLHAHAPGGSAIVSAIIALAHSLQMDVVAEGVETASQHDKLKAMLCDEMQGFLLGRSLMADAFGALLQERMASV